LITFVIVVPPMAVLGPAILAQRTRAPPADLRKLNLWGLQLVDISALAEFPNLEILCLSTNCIHSLAALTHCRHLTELFLRANEIDDFAEIEHLAEIPNLRILWLAENPIAADPSYRTRVLEILPQVMRLDDGDVTEADHRAVTPGSARRTRLSAVAATFPNMAPTEEPQADTSKGAVEAPPPKRLLVTPPADDAEDLEARVGVKADDRRPVAQPARLVAARLIVQSERPGGLIQRRGSSPPEQRQTFHDSDIADGDSEPRTPAVEEQQRTELNSLAFSLSRSGLSKRERRPREDDQALLSAILTLLPELKPLSLKTVIDACIELSDEVT
jgi:hypothetical protein